MTAMTPASYPLLSLREIARWEPLARELGVSVVARSPDGFLAHYKEARLARHIHPHWLRRRDAFIKRHMAQVLKRGEPLWRDGAPTRRHLALMIWAYSPAADGR